MRILSALNENKHGTSVARYDSEKDQTYFDANVYQ